MRQDDSESQANRSYSSEFETSLDLFRNTSIQGRRKKGGREGRQAGQVAVEPQDVGKESSLECPRGLSLVEASMIRLPAPCPLEIHTQVKCLL